MNCPDCGHPSDLHADLGPCMARYERDLFDPWFRQQTGWVLNAACPCERGRLELEANRDRPR